MAAAVAGAAAVAVAEGAAAAKTEGGASAMVAGVAEACGRGSPLVAASKILDDFCAARCRTIAGERHGV